MDTYYINNKGLEMSREEKLAKKIAKGRAKIRRKIEIVEMKQRQLDQITNGYYGSEEKSFDENFTDLINDIEIRKGMKWMN